MSSTEVCPVCRGSGWYYDAEEREQTCRCEQLRRARLCLQRHGLEGVKPGRGLLTPALEPIRGRFRIRCRWDQFKAHFAGWLVASYFREPDVCVHVTDDTGLRNLRLGQRPGASKVLTGSVMDDLRPFSLVVVRFRPSGEHKANVGAIVEAIDRSRMIWFVESPSRPLENHPAWCAELEDVLVEEGFTLLDLAGAETETGVADRLFGGGAQ